MTWGCHLSMSYVDVEDVREFISKFALKGPEQIENDGDFDKDRSSVSMDFFIASNSSFNINPSVPCANTSFGTCNFGNSAS